MSDRDERIIEFLGDMIDGGVWPYPGAVKALGGREVMRRALRAMDALPIPIRSYSAGPCGNIPSEPARHANTATSLSSRGLASTSCPETELP